MGQYLAVARGLTPSLAVLRWPSTYMITLGKVKSRRPLYARSGVSLQGQLLVLVEALDAPGPAPYRTLT